MTDCDVMGSPDAGGLKYACKILLWLSPDTFIEVTVIYICVDRESYCIVSLTVIHISIQ